MSHLFFPTEGVIGLCGDTVRQGFALSYSHKQLLDSFSEATSYADLRMCLRSFDLSLILGRPLYTVSFSLVYQKVEG
jgi:hypothetical protein